MGKNSKRYTWRKKAIRLENYWDAFIIEHPEIELIFNEFGQIVDIQFPPETEHILLILNMNLPNNNVMYLSYTYLGNLVHYEDDFLKD